MTDKPTNKLLYDAIKDRGTAYLMVFRELKARYGEDETKDVMRIASRAHGLYIGKSLACCAPRGFECMANRFAKSPDDGSVFCPDIRRLDSTCLEVKMMACPLKDAWVEAGCSDEEVVTLLYCASALDEATLEAAGFDYEIELWSPGQEGCCLNRITERGYRTECSRSSAIPTILYNITWLSGSPPATGENLYTSRVPSCSSIIAASQERKRILTGSPTLRSRRFQRSSRVSSRPDTQRPLTAFDLAVGRGSR